MQGGKSSQDSLQSNSRTNTATVQRGGDKRRTSAKLQLTHSTASSISALSAYSEPDSFKVSEMIDGTNGRPTRSWKQASKHDSTEHEKSPPTANHSATETKLSKAQKKRLKAKNARSQNDIGLVSPAAEDVVLEEVLPVAVTEALPKATAAKKKWQRKKKTNVGEITTENVATAIDGVGAPLISMPKPRKAVRQSQSVDLPPTPTDSQASTRPIRHTLPETNKNNIKDTVARTHPLPPSDHKRQKSYDIRVRLNGSQERTVQVDTPTLSPVPTAAKRSNVPLTIRIPGQQKRLIWPEKELVVADESSDSSNEIKLESRLQDMILSHTPASGAVARPDVTAAPGLSSNSAIAAPPGVPTVAPGLRADPVLHESYTHIPRSLTQGPPSLPPPQVQNIPAQIPDPYDNRDVYHSSYTGHQTAYNHYYPPAAYYPQQPYYIPSQHYYPGYQHTMMPYSAPFMTDMMGSGMVYYSADGQPLTYPPNFQHYYHDTTMTNQPDQQNFEFHQAH